MQARRFEWKSLLCESPQATTGMWGTPLCNSFWVSGKHQGMSHPSTPILLFWLNELPCFDLTFDEQAKDFPVYLIRDTAGNTHFFLYAIFGGDDIGFPKRRTRFRCCIVSHDKFVWCGESIPEDGNVSEDSVGRCFTPTIARKYPKRVFASSTGTGIVVPESFQKWYLTVQIRVSWSGYRFIGYGYKTLPKALIFPCVSGAWRTSCDTTNGGVS